MALLEIDPRRRCKRSSWFSFDKNWNTQEERVLITIISQTNKKHDIILRKFLFSMDAGK